MTGRTGRFNALAVGHGLRLTAIRERSHRWIDSHRFCPSMPVAWSAPSLRDTAFASESFRPRSLWPMVGRESFPLKGERRIFMAIILCCMQAIPGFLGPVEYATCRSPQMRNADLRRGYLTSHSPAIDAISDIQDRIVA